MPTTAGPLTRVPLPPAVGPGVYEITQDCEFECPGTSVEIVDGEEVERPGLRGLVNTGARDCVAYVYARDDIVPLCPCMIHADRKGAHAAGGLFLEHTLFAGQGPTMFRAMWIPTGYPLIVKVKGFVAGTPPVPVPVPESNPPPTRNAQGFEMGVAPRVVSGVSCPGNGGGPHEMDPVTGRCLLCGWPRPQPSPAPLDTAALQRAMYERKEIPVYEQQPSPAPDPYRMPAPAPAQAQRPVAPPVAPAALFPGFIVSCEKCGSVHISIDTRPNGKAYLECEDCGNMGRLKIAG